MDVHKPNGLHLLDRAVRVTVAINGEHYNATVEVTDGEVEIAWYTPDGEEETGRKVVRLRPVPDDDRESIAEGDYRYYRTPGCGGPG